MRPPSDTQSLKKAGSGVGVRAGLVVKTSSKIANPAANALLSPTLRAQSVVPEAVCKYQCIGNGCPSSVQCIRQGSCITGGRKLSQCNGLALHSFAHYHDLRKKSLGYLWLFELTPQPAARGLGRGGNYNRGLSTLPAVFAPATSCPLTLLLVVHLTCMIPGSMCICHSHSQGKGASCDPSSSCQQLLGWHLALDFLPHGWSVADQEDCRVTMDCRVTHLRGPLN